MLTITFIVNALVVCVLAAELVATALGVASPDQLLVSSILSGLLTILSFKLSKEALQHINGTPDAQDPPEGRVSGKV